MGTTLRKTLVTHLHHGTVYEMIYFQKEKLTNNEQKSHLRLSSTRYKQALHEYMALIVSQPFPAKLHDPSLSRRNQVCKISVGVTVYIDIVVRWMVRYSRMTGMRLRNFSTAFRHLCHWDMIPKIVFRQSSNLAFQRVLRPQQIPACTWISISHHEKMHDFNCSLNEEAQKRILKLLLWSVNHL